MKFFSKIFSAILVFSIFLTLILGLNVSATSATIAFNKSNLLVNEELVATVTVNADENMQALTFVLNYDPSIIEFTSGDSSSGGSGVVSVAHPCSNTTKVSLTYRFKALKAGNTSISMSDSVYVNIDEQKIGVPPQGGSVNVKSNDVALSSNADLQSLRTGVGTLSPAFSPNVTTYDVLIPNSETRCLVYASTSDKNATFVVEGSATMKIGLNKRVIIVTATDGTQKSYTLNITRSGDPNDTSSNLSTSSLTTSFGASDYIIASDISTVPIFNGFAISSTQYDGVDVPILTDSNGYYKIYYLKSPENEELIPCLLDNENNVFDKLKYTTLGENTYIFEDFPKDKTVSNDYYSASKTIFGHSIDCYASSSSKLSEFYYVYCYSNNNYGVYRFDERELTLQRFPEFSLNDISAQNTEIDDNIISRFNSLESNAKIMIIALIVAVLIAISLIILLIIKLFLKKNDDDFDDEFEEEFDSVKFDDELLTEDNEND